MTNERCYYECEIPCGDNHKYACIRINTSIYIFLFQNASAQAALQAASALSGQNETQGGPNTVLRVIVEHMVYPVTLEVLCQVSGKSQNAAYWNAPCTHDPTLPEVQIFGNNVSRKLCIVNMNIAKVDFFF